MLVTLIFLLLIWEKAFEKKFLEPRYMSLAGMIAVLTCCLAVVLPAGTSPYVLPRTGSYNDFGNIFKPENFILLSALLLIILTVGMRF